MDVHVSGHGGDGQDINLRRAQCHDQRHGIIGSGVGIDEKGALHATQDSKLTGEQPTGPAPTSPLEGDRGLLRDASRQLVMAFSTAGSPIGYLGLICATMMVYWRGGLSQSAAAAVVPCENISGGLS